MIIVTGGAGFIGSQVVSALNAEGADDILLVDHLGSSDKWKNLRGLRFRDYLDRDALPRFLAGRPAVEGVVHMGACSATTERDAGFLMENNYRCTLDLARWCLERGARFVYASSAATYGDGAKGYADDESRLEELRPLNMYGYSKHLFDLVARREGLLGSIAGVKFFNVFGPGEHHKGDMASVAYKSFLQVRAAGEVTLFRSHRPDFADGEQLRDFYYVKDAVRLVLFLLGNPAVNGIFNAGSGRARTFKDLVQAVFAAMGRPCRIRYVDMPEHLRDRYQYYTQADIAKVTARGHQARPTGLEAAVADYVQGHLEREFPG